MYDGKVIYMVENGAAYEKSIRHPLSLAQKSALKNISIKYKKPVYFNGRQVNGYDPELLDESSKNSPIGIPYRDVDKYPAERVYGAWIASNGTIYFITYGSDDGHAEKGEDILKHNHNVSFKKGAHDITEIYDNVYSRGYIRLVLDSGYNGPRDYIADNGDYRTTTRHPLTLSQKSALTNISIKYKTPMWFNGRKIKGYDPELLDENTKKRLNESKRDLIKVSYTNVDKYPLSRPYGAWIDSKGIIYFTREGQGHNELAWDILEHIHKDIVRVDSVEGFYDQLYSNSYIRLVLDSAYNGKREYMADNGDATVRHLLTLSQKAALRNISIKYKTPMSFNDRKIKGYDPELLD
jgi:phage gp46-like protein